MHLAPEMVDTVADYIAIFVLFFVHGRDLMVGETVAGFPFLASIIAIFSGAQLFALGIIGEYLGRMHLRMMERPPYIVRAATLVRTAAPSEQT